MVCVKLEQLTVTPLLIDTVDKIILDVAVPTVPSSTAVPSDFVALKNDAVPVAAATPEAMALAVNTPALAAGNAVALKVNVTNKVLPDSAVSPVAGCVPL